ncbi:hypothetical protein SACE_5099 [Saccharopolyspora erythraea NRRL 2338]|uniref:Uncharacterized protein n=1 Tax=Saccharopolyspora erythraea (strain ATCC 11635 / DSM 40517 / JCM 4748 / NBRC 13426 / NCIMB 8594 / NRRL 2338) TaxID=405948 RepID=A4FJX7_SACEN|nr:hypothetical protein SACE_5099 [Saccharopolyspora erythraea NRRL 2338]
MEHPAAESGGSARNARGGNWMLITAHRGYAQPQ